MSLYCLYCSFVSNPCDPTERKRSVQKAAASGHGISLLESEVSAIESRGVHDVADTDAVRRDARLVTAFAKSEHQPGGSYCKCHYSCCIVHVSSQSQS